MSTSFRGLLYAVSALLSLVGAMLFVSRWVYAPYLFAVGAAGITLCYLTAPVGGLDVRHRRLHRLNALAGIAMIAASVFMFHQRMEWLACLLIAALVQLYTSFAAQNRPK